MKVTKLEDQCPYCNSSVSVQFNPMIIGHFGLIQCSRCGNMIMIEENCQNGPVLVWAPTKQNLKCFGHGTNKSRAILHD